MKNYNVRNCPAFRGWLCDEQFLKTDRMLDCKDIHNCLLKRIYERCELYGFNYPINQAIQMLTRNIKNMLEIEECE